MKIRYRNINGKMQKSAVVYEQSEHRIDFSKVDKDSVSIITKLRNGGFEAYLVGGAVRDLLLGKTPKDFDIVTSATPSQVHRIFSRSRIIGRRFRIVHVFAGNKIFEVSTFRKSDTQYGTIEDDCKRRDFSLNSFYYDPESLELLDFTDSMSDLKKGKIRSIIPLSYSFSEDPVRMIRAIKYSVTTGFYLPFDLKSALRRNAPLLAGVSTSRLTEELNKILASGYSSKILHELNRYKMLVYLLPCISVYSSYPQISKYLELLDEKVLAFKEGKTKEAPSVKTQYLALVYPLISIDRDLGSSYEIFKDVFRQIKVLISPNTPANYIIEDAAKTFLSENGITLNKPGDKKRKMQKRAIRNSNNSRRIKTKPEQKG